MDLGKPYVSHLTVIRPNASISPEQARRLLRRFRDLNLGPCGIEVSEQARVTVAGCLSLDHPVEGGVRYSLREEEGAERVLDIRWRKGRLALCLEPDAEQCLDVELACDGLGRLAAPDLGARMHLERANPREIEHFLRRIVRAVYARAA